MRDYENGNGRKWWKETWGKAVGGIITAAVVAVGAWALVTGRTILGLPPRVDSLEMQMQNHLARPISDQEAQAIAKAIAAEYAKQQKQP